MSLPRGLSAFPITPADAAGRIDIAAYSKLVERLARAGVDSIGALGSTGSYMFLDRQERRRALLAAIDVVGGHVPIIAGVGALRTDHAVGFARDATEVGASAGLLSAVSYTPLTQDEVAEHVRTVVRDGGLPICLYDNPGAAGFSFTPELISQLAALPGVLGIKNPTTNAATTIEDLARQRTATPQDFSIGFSGDSLCTEALIAGADIWYSVLAGILPTPCVQIAQAVARGDITTARQVNADLAPVWALFKAHSSLRVVYAMAGVLGLTEAAPALPIQPLSASAVQDVEAVLKVLPGAFLV